MPQRELSQYTGVLSVAWCPRTLRCDLATKCKDTVTRRGIRSADDEESSVDVRRFYSGRGRIHHGGGSSR
jgi:hypothetical protein